MRLAATGRGRGHPHTSRARHDRAAARSPPRWPLPPLRRRPSPHLGVPPTGSTQRPRIQWPSPPPHARSTEHEQDPWRWRGGVAGEWAALPPPRPGALPTLGGALSHPGDRAPPTSAPRINRPSFSSHMFHMYVSSVLGVSDVCCICFI